MIFRKLIPKHSLVQDAGGFLYAKPIQRTARDKGSNAVSL